MKCHYGDDSQLKWPYYNVAVLGAGLGTKLGVASITWTFLKRWTVKVIFYFYYVEHIWILSVNTVSIIFKHSSNICHPKLKRHYCLVLLAPLDSWNVNTLLCHFPQRWQISHIFNLLDNFLYRVVNLLLSGEPSNSESVGDNDIFLIDKNYQVLFNTNFLSYTVKTG